MSKYTEEELNRVLSDTGELLKDIPLSQDYDLEDILAEFGTGATKPKASSRPESSEPEASPPVTEEPEPAPAPRLRSLPRSRKRRRNPPPPGTRLPKPPPTRRSRRSGWCPWRM